MLHIRSAFISPSSWLNFLRAWTLLISFFISLEKSQKWWCSCHGKVLEMTSSFQWFNSSSVSAKILNFGSSFYFCIQLSINERRWMREDRREEMDEKKRKETETKGSSDHSWGIIVKYYWYSTARREDFQIVLITYITRICCLNDICHTLWRHMYQDGQKPREDWRCNHELR